MARVKLTKREIDRAAPAACAPDKKYAPDSFLWDTEVMGLGLRVSRGGTKSFVFQYRRDTGKHAKRVTLGRYGTQLTLDQARKRARSILGSGSDPAAERRARREAKTVRDLSAKFMAEHASKRADSTRRNYQMLWDLHLLPALGSKAVGEVTWGDINALHERMKETPYMANRVLSLVSKAFGLAMRWGMFPEDRANPGGGHDRYEELRPGRSLQRGELKQLGKALAEKSDRSLAAAAVRTCILTGCRPSEIRNLRWSELDEAGRVVDLPETKTGRRTIYLGTAAAAIVATRPRIGEYVFPGKAAGKPLHDFKDLENRLRKNAKLSCRPYDWYRHTFISWGLELGVPIDRLKIIVGHSTQSGRDVTGRYTHYRTATLLADADKISSAIDAALRGAEPQSKVVAFPGSA